MWPVAGPQLHGSSRRKALQIGVILRRILRLSGIFLPSDWFENHSCISATNSAWVVGKP